MLWVIWNGQLRRSRLFAPTVGATAAILLGLLFQIQHWAGTMEMLVGGGVALAGIYSWWFSRKPGKSRLDVLKFSYVVCLGLWSLALGMGWRSLLPWLSSGLLMSFWAVLLDFVYVTYVRRTATE